MSSKNKRKIFFFACSRKQRNYFAILAEMMTAQGTLIWYKTPTLFLPGWLPYSQVSDLVEQEINKSANSRGRAYGHVSTLLLKLFHWFRACWLHSKYYSLLQRQSATHTLVWNGLKFRQQIWCLVAQELKLTVYFMENGLLNGYTTLDRKGVNYGNSVPRDTDYFCDDNFVLRGKAFLSARQVVANPAAASFILVPLQVNSDSQVVCYSPWIRNMRDLCSELIRLKPVFDSAGYQVVVKPHPKCPTHQDDQYKRLETMGIRVVDDQSVSALLPQASAVITLNSTVGIEALIQGIPVIVLGEAFYNLPGLTLSARSTMELTESIRAIGQWQPDETLRRGLFGYLAGHYQIKGDWQQAEPEHIHAIVERLNEFLSYEEGGEK